MREQTKRPRQYIEVDVFAGAPNPRWTLPDDQMQDILAQVVHLPAGRLARGYLEPNSWYGGITVHVDSPSGLSQSFVVHDEHVFEAHTDIVRMDSGRQVEQRLYSLMPADQAALLDNQTFQALSAALNEDKDVEGATAGEPKPACETALPFPVSPPASPWDKLPGREDNNCYNYANDVFSTVDDALPGGKLRHEWTRAKMHELVTDDGLVPVSNVNNTKLPTVCLNKPQVHLVAISLRKKKTQPALENGVQVENFGDFHCFRLDAGGVWSHKDGSKKIKNTDNATHPLLDLGTGNFKLEHFLVGYYWTFPGPHRKIRMGS